jgi:hypothetical protein
MSFEARGRSGGLYGWIYIEGAEALEFRRTFGTPNERQPQKRAVL